jgi:hypothetical protein
MGQQQDRPNRRSADEPELNRPFTIGFFPFWQTGSKE